ncbi:MAG: phage holin family protein [Erythrobacter sp.]
MPAPAPEPAAEEDAGGLGTLKDDVSALVDDARNYAAAEIAFQKTRAGLAGKKAARALILLVLALVLLNLALVALAVGAVIALAPLVTIWGAIAIVVGVLLAGVAVLVMRALGEGKTLGAMFGDEA